MSTWLEDTFFGGGADEAAQEIKKGWLRYAQNEGRLIGDQVRRMDTGYDNIQDKVYAGYDRSRDQFNRGVRDAQSRYEPYAGDEAQEIRKALSGALGPEAREEAYANYRESPGVAWARERGLREINRNAAAGGAMSSGNRYKAITEFSQGLAEQDFNNYWNRLGEIAGTGFTAAQNQANLDYSAGLSRADREERATSADVNIQQARLAHRLGYYDQQRQSEANAILGSYEAESAKEGAKGNAYGQLGAMGVNFLANNFAPGFSKYVGHLMPQ